MSQHKTQPSDVWLELHIHTAIYQVLLKNKDDE